MLKTFLKPGWVLLLLFVVAFSYLAFTVLAPWQLGKDKKIVERNELITEAYEADPRPLGAALGDAPEWSRVTAHGHYLPDKEVLVRLRPVASGPSYQSLVPFVSDAGVTVLVNRGWVAAEEGNAVPDIAPAPPGPVEITAMVRRSEATPSTAPIEQEGYTQVYGISTTEVGELTSTDIASDYLQLTEDQPGVLNAIPLPQLDRGNHLSYGYQWIAFGIMAPLGLCYFVWAEIRERRLAKQEQRALQTDPGPPADTVPEAPASAAPATSTPVAASSDRRSRSRYGDSKPDYYAKLRERRRER